MNFVEELQWRGMIHDITPGAEALLNKEQVSAYVGIDPTADSLHIGHLVSIMMLRHLQIHKHKPIAVLGGATGMIGDPSGKSKERNLLSEELLRANTKKIKKQLEKFLDFEAKDHAAIILNNYDWTKNYRFLDFLRDIGKHITINYMMAKDSVKKRLETGSGLSFTEFTYQLVQGYDFLHLFENHDCKLQLGGSDQWGNITTGTELIRRKLGKEAHALTCPLLTKPDGSKFGKTEEGNVWLDPEKTSSYKFFQFWMNCSDEEVEKYIKIFSVKKRPEVFQLISQHNENPQERVLQKALAEELTVRVHSKKDYETAVEASQILFGKGTGEKLKEMPEDLFLSVFEGVPQREIDKEKLRDGVPVIDFLATEAGINQSKGEARRDLKGNSISINKTKCSEDFVVSADNLLNGKYILVQKGKKNYFLVIAR